MGLLPLAPLSAREPDQIPIIVERMKERVDPAAVTAEISELWTSAAVMAGLRFPWELIKHCFGGITAMRESSTIRAFIEEGRQKGLEEAQARVARRMILRQGRIRFGDAGDVVQFRLEAISDEEWMPIAEIGIESVPERTPMTPFPAPNRLHVWWARRPLVASRAAILASLHPADADRVKFKHMLGIHGDPMTSRRRIDEARREWRRHASRNRWPSLTRKRCAA